MDADTCAYHYQLLSALALIGQPSQSRPLRACAGASSQALPFVVLGYVILPEHVHLLISEANRGNPSVFIQALKQGFARRLLRKLRSRDDPRQGSLWNAAVLEGHIWQRRFYDFVVWTKRKGIEKLRYMHRNPVTRALVLEPEHPHP